MLVLLVIIFAFGVSTQALMYEKQEINIFLLEKIFFNAYMVIAGENGYSEIMLEDGDCINNSTQNDCPDYNGKKISLFLYAIYVIILVILAVNILIAIFK
jgi:hypothetical protein